MLVEKLPIERLADLTIAAGGHSDRSNGLCAMELVAWMAGEPHSDQPACTSPVLAAFVRSWNDAISDDAIRTRLLQPILPRLIGTVVSRAVEQRRAELAFDWCVRVSTPAWLELADLKEEADALRSLRPLLDRSAVLAAQTTLNRARERADAAWAAAGDAAWAAAWAATWAATGAAARDATGAAARDAAWAAAGAAADRRLKPTVEQLQISALDLLERMIAVTEDDVRAS